MGCRVFKNCSARCSYGFFRYTKFFTNLITVASHCKEPDDLLICPVQADRLWGGGSLLFRVTLRFAPFHPPVPVAGLCSVVLRCAPDFLGKAHPLNKFYLNTPCSSASRLNFFANKRTSSSNDILRWCSGWR